MKELSISLFLMTFMLFFINLSCNKNKQNNELIAIVGQTLITTKDIKYRLGIEKAYGKNNTDSIEALMMLINDAVEQEVARKVNMLPTPQEIAAMDKHATTTSKAPEILSNVKKVFGDDTKSYRRIYLVPKIVNIKLHGFFSKDQKIHRGARLSIEKAFQLVSKGMPLKQAAQETNLQYSIYEDEPNKIPDQLARVIGKQTQEEDSLKRIINSLKVGEYYKEIIEDDYGYRIIRLIGRTGNKNKIEQIIARKAPYDDWFRLMARDIPISVNDESILKELKKRYSVVEWIRWIPSKQ